MQEYDDAVLECFLKKQLQLFPEKVVESVDEAEAFLEECVAVVAGSIDEVWEYFNDEGIDLDGQKKEDIAAAEEVFEIGDGRYLIVES